MGAVDFQLTMPPHPPPDRCTHPGPGLAGSALQACQRLGDVAHRVAQFTEVMSQAFDRGRIARLKLEER
jgi:hypothetical protein